MESDRIDHVNLNASLDLRLKQSDHVYENNKPNYLVATPTQSDFQRKPIKQSMPPPSKITGSNKP